MRPTGKTFNHWLGRNKGVARPKLHGPTVTSVKLVMPVQVGALLGALTAKDRLTNDQANSLIATAVNATVNAGSVRRSAKQQLTDDVRSAMAQQTEASRRSEVQAKKAKQKNAEQLADLHRPKVCFVFSTSCPVLLLSSVIWHDSYRIRVFQALGVRA